jgi:hypothetical protein
MPANDWRHLEELYETGIRLLFDGDEQGALQCFKNIYEVDYTFRDVAQLVEDSIEPDWATKHRARIRERADE